MATKSKRTRVEPATRAPQQTRSETETETSGGTSLDVDALRQIVEILEASDVTRLVWRRGRERLFIRRGQPTAPAVQLVSAGPQVSHMPTYAAPQHTMETHAAPSTAPSSGQPTPTAPAARSAATGQVVTSPFVGTFYRTPAPDQPPFVEVGGTVKKGQVLCIIEAMKLMNEIESEISGRVAEVLVDNATPVEFGQALFRIEPA